MFWNFKKGTAYIVNLGKSYANRSKMVFEDMSATIQNVYQKHRYVRK